jgi:polar amino acid transport system substrate-binding protein
MKAITRILAVGGVTVAALGLSACGQAAGSSAGGDQGCEPRYKFDTIAEGKLTIAAPDSPPFYLHGKNEGIDYEFISQFAEDSCLEAVWNVVPPAAAIEGVGSRRADLAVGGWYANEQRGQVVNQTNASYLGLPTIFADEPIDTVGGLEGLTVATVNGYAWNEELEARLGGDRVREYQNANEALSDLAVDRVDAAVLGSTDAPYLVKVNGNLEDIESETMQPDEAITTSMQPAHANYPHTKGNDELTAALNEALAAAHESGEFADILERYGVDPAMAETDQPRG